MKTLDQVRDAYEKSEFSLEYMPTMSQQTGDCVGAEALIRWRRHDERIAPDEFIPLIEHTPLSGLITFWVIEEIAHELGPWLRETEGVHIGINIPPELVGRGGIEYAARKSGLIKVIDKLILEVTERGLLDEQGLHSLQEAKGKVKVAIDDFGTGDANMMEMSKMEADIIKIDKFFTDQITSEKNVPRIVKGLIAFAEAMEFGVIAEGVETKVQAKVLKNLHVDMAQGWYYSKPLPAEEFLAFCA